ncbi:hypothetical protein F5888DRAFT_1746901 [Russula emetica]|nr:hypothetical protein F5888DRAFT_1746901 [Russula emetica]
MTWKQQFTVVLLVSVKCIILSMIEGTNNGALKREHIGETAWAHGPWAIEQQVTVGAIDDDSFVHSRHEVQFGVIPKAPETFGYQTLDGWPRTDGGWECQGRQVLQGAPLARPLHGQTASETAVVRQSLRLQVCASIVLNPSDPWATSIFFHISCALSHYRPGISSDGVTFHEIRKADTV